MKPIKIDRGFFISSKPHTGKDVKEIAELGVKQVIFIGSYLFRSSSWVERFRFKRFGIQVNTLPPQGFHGTILATLGMMQKPCLVHCWAGISSQDVAVAYWMARGFSPAKAMANVQRALHSNNVEIHLSGLNFFRSLREKVFDPKLANAQKRIEAARATRLSKRFDRSGRTPRQRSQSRIKRNVGRRI